jgi:hypothetical protein
MLLMLLAPLSEAKNCTKGKPCGRTCIAVTDTCRSAAAQPTPAPSLPPEPPSVPTFTVRAATATHLYLSPGDPSVIRCAIVAGPCAPVASIVEADRALVAEPGTIVAPVLSWRTAEVSTSCTVTACAVEWLGVTGPWPGP